jgi:hypothetical protein
MKNINFLLLFVILFGFAISNKAKADCPPNWGQRGITFQVGNCLYFADYCYKCGVTGPDPGNVKVTKYGKLTGQDCDDSGITMEEVVEMMLQQISQRYLDDCTIPPCSTGTMARFIVEYPLCHKHFNHAWTDDQGNRRHFYWWESCNIDFYCQRVRECCYLNNGELSCVYTQIQPQGSPLGCQRGLVLPPDGYTWDDDWETDCFYDTRCE